RRMCGAGDALSRPVSASSFVGPVDHHGLQRVEIALPRLSSEAPPRVRVARLPSRADAGAREVYVLCVILMVEAGRQKAPQVHRRAAAIFRELLYLRIISLVGRDAFGQL